MFSSAIAAKHTLKLGRDNSQFPIQTTPVSREMSLSRICRFSLLYHQKRNFNARFSPEAKREIAEAMLQGEFLRVPSVRLDPGLRAIGNGAATVLPAAGHMLMIEDPSAALAALRTFL